MSQFELSVVVPTCNRSHLIPGLFAALERQTFPLHLWELVIVNDGSLDKTSEMLAGLLERASMRVIVIEQAQQGGASARNAGAHRATGRSLLFLDDDMIPTKKLIAEHARIHCRPAIAAVGRMCAQGEREDPWSDWEDAQLNRYSTTVAEGGHVVGPRDFYSGNCSTSADMFRAVGGFRTDLKRGYDIELGYRLKAAGARFVHLNMAESAHIGSHSFEAWLQNARWLGECEVTMGWDLGHTELRSKIFEWYISRHPLSRCLVRLCSSRPELEPSLIACIDRIGRISYRLGAVRVARAAYAAIFNLAYWMRIIGALQPGLFWRQVARTRARYSRR